MIDSGSEMFEIVGAMARSRNLLAPDGSLQIDSMTVIDFVLSLEDAAGVEVPDEEILASNFTTVEDVVALLRRLKK
jgi:acyl carrier protein